VRRPGIQSVEDLIKLRKIDMTVWKIARFEIGEHEGFYRDKSMPFNPKKPHKSGWYRTHKVVRMKAIKLFLARITDDEQETAKLRRELIKSLSKHSPIYVAPRDREPVDTEDPLLAEVAIYDHHFGKLGWGLETGGGNYDLKIASDVFRQSVDAHCRQLHGLGVTKILVTIGNDLFHTDNGNNTTTAGTPQDVDSRWQKSWMAAKKSWVYAIDRFREIADVEGVVVPGNHDREKVFVFGDVIQTHYRQVPEVTINNGPKLRKYYEWGNVLLGFTHGNEEKHQALPGLMANEMKEAWARTSHREWHIGHLHTRREWRFNAGDVHDGVHVRILPSLCDTDAWHAMRGYVGGPRASEMYLWRKRAGYVGHLAFNPETK
jgi:hypothetical protein